MPMPSVGGNLAFDSLGGAGGLDMGSASGDVRGGAQTSGIKYFGAGNNPNAKNNTTNYAILAGIAVIGFIAYKKL